jgi:hypothetical protein
MLGRRVVVLESDAKMVIDTANDHKLPVFSEDQTVPRLFVGIGQRI